MPVLRSKPRHAKPQQVPGAKAVLIPVVLMGSSGTALGGLAMSASAADSKTAVPTAAVTPSGPADLSVLADRAALAEQRASRSRSESAAAEQAAAAQAAAEQAAAAQAAAQAAAEQAARQAAQEAAARAASSAVAAPTGGGEGYVRPGIGKFTSGYGARWGRLHKGVDLAGPVGSGVFAVTAGTVTAAGWESGYGYVVRLRHADGTETMYAHNASLLVRAGQVVAAGQQVAREGSTGNSTGPHVHFEVVVGGRNIDPLPWLRARGVAV